LAALGCGKLKLSENKLLLENEFSQSIFAALEKHDVQLTKQAPWSVKIHDTDRCSRYMALRLDLATMPATPAEIVRRLEAAGQRSINLIVDITNYVLLEWGQPLHAFDVDKLSGQEIHVRVGQSGGGKPGEKILALDEKEYLLTNNDLLICDAKQPHCIAGVMGGKHSAVTTETRHLLLESASFASATVRTTAKRLGLSSESSYRFERGVDPEITPYGLAKAAALIMKLVPGVTIHQIIDQRPKEFIANRATYRSSRFARLMGYSQDLKQAQKHLTDLGAKILEASGDTLHLLTPSWRPDLVHEIDLIEEVARLSGYEQIPIHLPSSQPDAQLERHADRQLAQLQGYLTGQGFHEVKNLAFIAPDQLGEIPAIKLTNPLASDLGVMRPTLLPGLLKNFRHNYDHYKQHKAIRLFEIGTIFQPQTSETNGASKDDSRQPNWGKETLSLALIAWQGEMPSWQGKLPATDFFWIKAIVENLLKMLTDSKVIFSDKSDYLLPFLHPTVKSDLLLENKIIGSLGRVHPERLPDDCQAPVVVFEFNLGRFLSGRSKQLAYHAYSSFPVVERDLAILVGDEIASASLLQIIQKSAKPLLHDVQLIDRYVGEKLPAGKKSLAFRLWFQAPDRTLKDEEVESLIQQSLSKLTQEFGATLRS
jgi:phenylalanyl-tRNA synthetase beta chain